MRIERLPWQCYLKYLDGTIYPSEAPKLTLNVSERNLGIRLVMRRNVKKIVEPCAPGVALNVRNAIYLGDRNWNLAQNSQKHTDLPQPALSYDTRHATIHHQAFRGRWRNNASKFTTAGSKLIKLGSTEFGSWVGWDSVSAIKLVRLFSLGNHLIL